VSRSGCGIGRAEAGIEVKAVERAGKIRGGDMDNTRRGVTGCDRGWSTGESRGKSRGKIRREKAKERAEVGKRDYRSACRRPGEPKTQTNKSIKGGPRIEGGAERRAEIGVEVRADAQAEVKAINIASSIFLLQFFGCYKMLSHGIFDVARCYITFF
jgi:hypothetical protein